MSDEIDLLKYLLNNLKMQQTLLYKIIKKKEVGLKEYKKIRESKKRLNLLKKEEGKKKKEYKLKRF